MITTTVKVAMSLMKKMKKGIPLPSHLQRKSEDTITYAVGITEVETIHKKVDQEVLHKLHNDHHHNLK